MCKISGCNRPAEANMGPYAGLCIVHKEEAKEQRALNRNSAREAKKQQENGHDEAVQQEIRQISRSRRQLTRSAGQIVKAAERFEIALEERDKAKSEARNALAKLDTTLEEFKRIARAKLNSGYESSK
jgi:hypothetical protein